MILIHPPVAKPGEPPAGIAKLSGSLNSHGIKHTVLDANLEALLYIIDNTHPQPHKKYDTWTARALRNISNNHESIKSRRTFQNIDRYKRAVFDLNHAIEHWAGKDVTPGIANYRDKYLSPLKSDDLIKAAECPRENPYYPYFSKRLPAIVESDTTRVVGVSLNYLSQALTSFAIIGFLKANFPGLSFVLGGGLVTSWMNRPDWRSPFSGLIDHLVAGSGEQRLLEILGVNYLKEKHSRPDYGSLPLDDYLSPGIILPYSASVGCYWSKCSFCPEKAEKNPYLPLPVDTVLKDLDELITQTKPLLLHLVDNAISTSLLRRIAESGLGVPWYGFARISRLLTDIDFCMDLKKSGCIMLKLGLESGDQGVLDKMNKGIDLETASTALKTLKKAGITTYVYLIFGTPTETITAARNTLEFVVRHKDEIGFLNVALFNMPVSGPEVTDFETRNFYEGDLSLYSDYSHPKNWNRREVRRFLDDEFRKNRAVSGILIKNPPIFTSNHAPLFVM
jgi:hypothetical protein